MSNPAPTVPLKKKFGDTTSKHGESCRLFVSGNLDDISTQDLELHFGKYGRITGIDINRKGFAFVQFTAEEHAKNAISVTEPLIIKGQTLEVRLFNKRKPNGQDRSRSPIDGYDGDRTSPSNRPNFRRQPRNFYPRFSSSPQPPPPGHYGGFNGGPPPQAGPPPHAYGYPPAGPPMHPPMHPAAFPPSVVGQPPQMVPPPQAATGNGYGMPRQQFNRTDGSGNDIEIIVTDRAQWGYAEMVEKRLRQETPLKFIDMLFLHSPEHIKHTLNDLFERRTLYAIVITPLDEQKQSFTLHILHNQSEHRNISISEGIALLHRDFCNFMGKKDPFEINYQSQYSMPTAPSAVPQATGAGSQPSSVFNLQSVQPKMPTTTGAQQQQQQSLNTDGRTNKHLTPEIKRSLEACVNDNTAAFLSLQQINDVISYFTSFVKTQQNTTATTPSTLLEDPKLKAALSTLLQMGAINSNAAAAAGANSGSTANNNNSSSNSNNTSTMYPTIAGQVTGTSSTTGYTSTSGNTAVQQPDVNSYAQQQQLQSVYVNSAYEQTPSYQSSSSTAIAPTSVGFPNGNRFS